MHHDGTLHIDDTADLIPGHDRIRSACYFDGNEDRYIVQFFRMPGSIARAVYDKHAPSVRVSFVPVDCWQYDALVRMHEGETYTYSI